MASSGVNSFGSGSSQPRSEEDMRVLMDERKRRRMESNRESARRSRMKKWKQVDDLTVQIDRLRDENNQISTSVSITTQHLANVEAENLILGAQLIELSHRLDSLNGILGLMNTANDDYSYGFMNNAWNLMCMNQPIIANDDFFQF